MTVEANSLHRPSVPRLSLLCGGTRPVARPLRGHQNGDARRAIAMKPGETKKPVRCEICGQAMRLTRITPVASQRECYEFWQCIACGHTHLRAIDIRQKNLRRVEHRLLDFQPQLLQC